MQETKISRGVLLKSPTFRRLVLFVFCIVHTLTDDTICLNKSYYG